ncbi:uncharacterized protein PGTG_15904 [Puccinia graminis f. sp. tritici CRL 75-36-700-3]|uniref:DDE Tnp4 domain-containing protein n=1 Tax=Puccinia graminis f. sp. tritici (strain CRL 75-36-700-3 / race SCCL) TaxID=418459 RepID=E3L0F8_PUCGT|nr:uncharacterized protein PGTG_15904 [Puccinia graminis f. sp. tritici CRL 75-36-700-3]EFP90056.2 hypothetical protein PGTG_15904 [Puccinia graminis f. sp. tritici CRL 75-36-700-3]
MHNINLAYLEVERQMQATYEHQQRDNRAIRVQTEASFVEQENTRKRLQDEEAALLPFALGAMGCPGVFRQLRTSRSDRAFVTTKRIDVATFDNLLKQFATRWDTRTISRGDLNPNGEPQIGRRCLDAPSCLGLVLHWLCSTMAAYTLQQLFAITGLVCSRYLAYGMDLLLEVLQEHPEARFLWPTNGLNLPVLVSGYEDCIFVFAPDGSIMYVILNAPGSWHDSTIAEPLYEQLLEQTPVGY